MSDTVEIPIPDFAATGAVEKKVKRPAKVAAVEARAAAPDSVALEGLSLNSALAEIESARITKATPRKPLEKAKRPPPKYVRKRP
jgi:hypothetical protein